MPEDITWVRAAEAADRIATGRDGKVRVDHDGRRMTFASLDDLREQMRLAIDEQKRRRTAATGTLFRRGSSRSSLMG